MTLNLSKLEEDLEALAANPKGTIAGCAQDWADAMKAYASGIVPASLAVDAASEALATALTSAFASGAAAPGMETAFATFAATIGSGMAPAFAATPPPNPVGFATQFAKPHPASHSAAATALSALINTWMKSGKATPSGGGSPVGWN